jgi:hypothetical protein
MGLPHSTEPYTQLRKVVTLPAAKPPAARAGGSARSRRRAGG